MSKADTWMPLHIGDYLSDTGHLRTIEHGMYLLLLMQYWRTGPLPDDDVRLAAIARVSRKEWAQAAPTIRQMFTPLNGVLHQKRADLEREKASKLSDKRRAVAEARWGAKPDQTPDKPDAIASPIADQKHTPDRSRDLNLNLPSESSVLRTGDKPPPDDPKATLWREGVSILKNLTNQAEGPAKKLLGKLLDIAKADHSRLLELLRRAETEQPSEPVPWLMAAAKGQNGHQTTVAGQASWPHGVIPERDTGRPLVNGYYIEETAENACEAAGFSQDRARDQWPAIIPWLQADVPPQAIRETIQRIAERPGYVRPASLAYFDKPIRELRGQA